MFQYPHRIVGGFKQCRTISRKRTSSVSVSSSDRRGVQVVIDYARLILSFGFSILIGSSGGSSRQPGGARSPARLVSVSSSDRRGVQDRNRRRGGCGLCSFSILIGSSGGSSQCASRFCPSVYLFQYPHRIVGGFKVVTVLHPAIARTVSVSSSDRRGVQDCGTCHPHRD